MKLYKTKGIILKNFPFSEDDKIATIYTTIYGKISGIAKGVRKTKSKFGSSMEIFTYCQVVFYGKEHLSLNVITQSEIVLSFREIRQDLIKIGYGSFIVELMDTMVSGRETDLPLFKLLLSTLTWLKEETTELIISVFSLKLLALLGIGLQLESCVLCHQPVLSTPDDNFRFSSSSGGIVCKNCAVKDSIAISRGVISVINQILRLDIGRIRRIKIASNILSQVQDIVINNYLNYHLPYKLKTGTIF